jgi:hypothetical protein
MTVTRNQRDEIIPISQEELGGLVRKSSEPTAISQPRPVSLEESIQSLEAAGAPKWLTLALQIAQDKRHDIAAPTLRFWKEKLKAFRDETVCEALTSGRWELFPSVDQVIAEVERLNERKRHENANRDWQGWKANMRRAQEEGLLASEEDYAEMRAALRRVFGDPTAKQTGK